MKFSPDQGCKAEIESLILEARALLARLDANMLADGAAWHVDAAINELYAGIGQGRPAADVEHLATLLNQQPTSPPH